MRTVSLSRSVDYADLIKIAKSVSKFREWNNALSPQQAFEIAYDAINSHVMRGEDLGREPSRFLAVVGRRAVRAHLGAQAIKPGPRYARYWNGERGYTRDQVEEVEERVALHQAMAGLSTEQQDDLKMLATTFDGASAAKLRGVGRQHFAKRCKKARLAFFALWFEGETIPALPKRVVNHVT